MGIFGITTKTIEERKAKYTPGTRIVLDHMGPDPRPIPDGTKGTVHHVDDAGQIQCDFDNGRHLAIVPEEDTFHIIENEQPLQIRPMTELEKMYCYTQSQQLLMQTGCIGYLRADFDSDGNNFYSTWFDYRKELKSDAFKAEFDDVINALREKNEYGGLLKGRSEMTTYCRKNALAFEGSYTTEYGVRVDTDHYSYLLRMNPTKGDYNLYCYCYMKEWLDRHMKNAEKGIRFIDSHYNLKFMAKDGEQIRIVTSDGTFRDMRIRYIDDYHFQASSNRGDNLYHICEFAEQFVQNRCRDIYPIKTQSHAENKS